MYTIVLDKGKPTEKIIQDSINNLVIDPHLIIKTNGCGTLEFCIPFDSLAFESLKERESIISVYDEYVTNKPIFRCKLLKTIPKFNARKKVYCEGDLARLNDTLYPPFEYQGSVDGLFESILNNHNSKSKDDDKLYPGTVTVTDPNNYINRSSEDYLSSWEVVKTRLLETLGGYIVQRWESDGKCYIDYLEELPANTQSIDFGDNLITAEKCINTIDLKTVLLPLGKEDDTSKERLNIKSVNDNSMWLVHPLANTYGRIESVAYFDDVTVASNLKSKGQALLNELVMKSVSVDFTAADLGYTSEQIKRFHLGPVTCNVSPLNFSGNSFINDLDIALNNPLNTRIKAGSEVKSYTSTNSSSISKIDELDKKINGNWLTNFINEQTSIITGGLGGNMRILYNSNGFPSGVAFMDSDNVVNARDVLLITYAGIGFSHNGLDGQMYNAWDLLGRLSADFIKAGKITGKMFEFDLDTGLCVWGKRDEDGEFIDGASIVFDAESMVIQAKKGLEVDDPTTEFRTTINERYWQITYQDEVKLYIDPTGGNMSNLSIDKYLNVSNTGRLQKFVHTLDGVQRTMLGMFYLGGNG